MTIDREKLKALAEAQPVQVWTRTRGRRPDMKGQPLMYGVEGPEGVSDYEDWGFTGKSADYIAAACPATVLALLAEIEWLESAKGDPVGSFDKHMGYMQENIRLKAENEDYRSGQDRYEQIIDDLKAENEALRKDTKRYRFLRNQHWPVAELSVVCNPKVSVKLGHDCPSGDRLDQQVDGAMIRGASHD